MEFRLFRNNRWFFLFFLVQNFSLAISASPVIDWKGTEDNHVKSYMKIFNDFREKTCVPHAEQIFDDLLKKYRGQGYWIPKIGDDVDVKAIEENIPLMQEKLNWINNQKKRVKRFGLPKADVTQVLKKNLRQALELKKNELSSSEVVKRTMRKKSLSLQNKLIISFEKLLERVSFLRNFKYPVDHLKNRKMYDTFKDDPTLESLANKIFLQRKILEDGAYNPDHTDSDMFLRTTLDTVHFELQMHDFYLTENARYDLQYVIKKIEAELSRGQKAILSRLEEWEKRTEKFIHFYQRLVAPESQRLDEKDHLSLNKKIVKSHYQATENLKSFVYEKQAEVYQYWAHRSEILRALFVIETILLNEVGSVDGEKALERKDVTRVIMNRLDLPRYLAIGTNEHLYPYVKKKVGDFYLENEKWLNALFKQGEFSFTYYYMSSVKNIFCPDISFRARKLREENIKIALDILKEGKSSFPATRYFSRASMTGRISMDIVWEDYISLPERPGPLVQEQKELLQKFKKRDYFYLYSFKDTKQNFYQVLEIDENPYVMKDSQFFFHRNPHYFKYFTKIKKTQKNLSTKAQEISP